MTTLLVLLTGGNTGLGYQTVKQLAQAGYKVLLGARSEEKARDAVQKILTEDNTIDASLIEPLSIDLDNDDSIAAAAKLVDSKFGHIDILINNAAHTGLANGQKTLREKMATAYNSNVIGTNLVIDAFVPLLQKSTASAPGRRIVNVSSSLGSVTLAQDKTKLWRAMQKLYEPYSLTKSALNLLTWYKIKELDGQNIAIVTTSPGYCATNLNEHAGVREARDGAKDIFEAATTGTFETMNGKFFELSSSGGEIPW
ncbi:NAD(P)-binding protein [Microthyrium microscopicum]|uniref:NAD(P)-binding protein n=1 Tax=Microthyrium microscopicum TaxID=703497 RepID=A0A6A6UC27_9PEZI|nr:NAD(P)-binding protein [Microthyrium microscopicum]